MSLVALDGTPLVKFGAIFPEGMISAWSTTTVVQDAVNEACIMYGQVITDDGLPHTIDTTGSSSLQWRSAAVTFASASSTLKVGLATLDAATGPPARATNVSDVITFSVSKTMIGGGGGVTASAWQTHVPDAGSLTVNSGDMLAFCTQLTARGGSDAVNVNVISVNTAPGRSAVTQFVGATYSASTTAPNCIIVFSDGHIGWFAGAPPVAGGTSTSWNNSSATKEYGNYLKFPFPVRIHGIYAMFSLSGDCDFVLYSDPFGSPVAERTVSADLNHTSANTSRIHNLLFSTPYDAAANQSLAVIAKPTTATSVAMTYRSVNDAAHQVVDHCGVNGYAVSRASGAFATQNANKDRFPIGFLAGAFDNAAPAPTPAPSLVSTGGLIRWPAFSSAILSSLSIGTDLTIDAAGEYLCYVYQAKENMTISHVGWRTGTVSGSPTGDVRIETVGADGMPTGTLYGTNTNAATGTLTSGAWTLHALTAAASVPKGGFFAVKFQYSSGTSIGLSRAGGLLNVNSNSPYRVTNVGTPAKTSMAGAPILAVGSSATSFYFLENTLPMTAMSGLTFNNTGGDRRGLRFQVPFACRCAGVQWANGSQVGDFNVTLYSDAGVELSSSQTSFEGDRSVAITTSVMVGLFDSGVQLFPGVWYRVTIEPTTSGNAAIFPITMPSSAYISAFPHRVNAQYTTYTTAGGWVDAADTLPIMELLMDQLYSGSDTAIDVQTYTSGSGTWTKPEGAVCVRVILLGGGGGAGGGDTAASGTGVGGGGSGGGACRHEAVFSADQLGATEPYSVGAGGAGGAAGTGSGGGSGTAGGNSTFGGNVVPVHTAYGGGRGAGGTAGTTAGGGGGAGMAGPGGDASGATNGAAGAMGGVAASASADNSGVGGGGGCPASGAGSNGGIGGSSLLSGCGGGGGAGKTSVPAYNTGGTGPMSPGGGSSAQGGQTSGYTIHGQNGGPGPFGRAGGGGGGGASSATGGGNGGNGGPGSGGGGGGATLTGQTAGTGGSGGSGFVIVITDVLMG